MENSHKVMKKNANASYKNSTLRKPSLSPEQKKTMRERHKENRERNISPPVFSWMEKLGIFQPGIK